MSAKAGVLFLARAGLALFGLVAGLPLLVTFSVLREMELFWRNDGGYPIWLRDLVLVAFYPILMIDLAVVLVYGCLLMGCQPRSKRVLIAEFGVLSLMAAALVFSVVWSILDDL